MKIIKMIRNLFRSEPERSRIDIAIGKFSDELNRKNSTFLVGNSMKCADIDKDTQRGIYLAKED